MIFWLYGPSGAGKTTLGRLLAERRSARFVDIDEMIESASGESVEQIFARRGQPVFRQLEREAIAACVLQKQGEMVIALGAGALQEEETRLMLRSTGLRFFLDIDRDNALQRLNGGAIRPLLRSSDPGGAWDTLYRSRLEHYLDADMRIDTAGSIDTVLGVLSEQIDRLLSPEWSRTWQLDGSACTVSIYSSVAALMNRLDTLVPAGSASVVTDTNVASLYAGQLGPAPGGRSVCAIEPGEQGKSLASVESIAGSMVEQGVSRDGTIIGIGGGVVTDLAGFVASIYMRGIDSVLVPTTLLAMVDAAIGGKTAVNAAGIRNLCGSFRQPRHVLISPAFLRTLPARELRSGIVEALKIGIMHEPALVAEVAAAMEEIRQGSVPARIGEIIRLAVETKFRVVEQDVLDSGIRLSLNFGHTFAHALEAVEPGRYTHGEAVAIGMIAATELARSLGIISQRRCAEIVAFLPALAPPTDGGHDMEALLLAMRGDKKRTRDALRFILPGEHAGFSVHPVDDPVMVRKALQTAFDHVSHNRKDLL